MVIFCVTTHSKTLLALESLRQWCYPQRRPYHALFREMPRVSPKHPQCPTVTNGITFIPSLDYPSIWPRKLAISLCLLQDISSWNRLIFWVLFPFWIIVISKLLPLTRWASIPSSDFLHHHRIPSPMHCFLVHVL